MCIFPAWPIPTNLMGRRERWRRYLPLELHGDLEVWHQSGEGGDGVGTGDEKRVGEDWLLDCRVGPHTPRLKAASASRALNPACRSANWAPHPPRAPLSSSPSSSSLTPLLSLGCTASVTSFHLVASLL